MAQWAAVLVHRLGFLSVCGFHLSAPDLAVKPQWLAFEDHPAASRHGVHQPRAICCEKGSLRDVWEQIQAMENGTNQVSENKNQAPKQFSYIILSERVI